VRLKDMISITLLFTRAWFSSSCHQNYHFLLDQIFLDSLIEYFTKMIKKSDLRLWSKLFYFLHCLNFVLHIIKNYSTISD
jgi:hypothetical protein